MKRSAAVFAALVAFVPPLLARAQSPASGANDGADIPKDLEARKVLAKARFDEGSKFYEQKAYDVALTEFKRSYAIYKSRPAGQNAALVLRAIGRFEEALDMVEDVIKNVPNIKAEDAARLEEMRVDLIKLVGFLVVRASEPSAVVTVDSVDRGKSPLSKLRLAAGAHTIRVTKEGFYPFETRADIGRQSTTEIEAKLGPLLQGGRLVVSEDRGRTLDVVVDGAVVGKTPWEGTLPVGRHSVFLRGDAVLGSQPASIEILLNQSTKLALGAEPVPCSLRVVPTPANAAVSVDGVDVGLGIWSGHLRCGGHRVDVVASGFVTKRETLSLREDRESEVRLALERDPTFGRLPTRFFVGGSGSFLVSPSMGGDLASSCNDACTGSLAVGTNASAQAGVRLGSGIGFFVSGGFVLLRKSYDARPAALQPVGFGPNVGTVHEDIRFSGPTFAAGALYQRGEQVRYSARLGAGVLFASYRSGREYSLTTADVAGTASGSGTPYTARASDDGSLVVPYVQLEARVGFPLSPGFVFEVGLGGFAWLGLDGARWSGNSQAHAGSCPNANPQICQGLASSAAESLFGGLVIAGGPVLGLAGDL